MQENGELNNESMMIIENIVEEQIDTKSYHQMLKRQLSKNQDLDLDDHLATNTIKNEEGLFINNKVHMDKTLNDKKRRLKQQEYDDRDILQNYQNNVEMFNDVNRGMGIANPMSGLKHGNFIDQAGVDAKQDSDARDEDQGIEIDKYGTLINTTLDNRVISKTNETELTYKNKKNQLRNGKSPREKLVFYWSRQDPSKSTGTLRAFSEDEYYPVDEGLIPAGANYSTKNNLRENEGYNQQYEYYDQDQDFIGDLKLYDRQKYIHDGFNDNQGQQDNDYLREDGNYQSQEDEEENSNPVFVKEVLLGDRRCLQDEQGNLWEIYAEEDVEDEPNNDQDQRSTEKKQKKEKDSDNSDKKQKEENDLKIKKVSKPFIKIFEGEVITECQEDNNTQSEQSSRYNKSIKYQYKGSNEIDTND